MFGQMQDLARALPDAAPGLGVGSCSRSGARQRDIAAPKPWTISATAPDVNRKLVHEAAANRILTHEVAISIVAVKGNRQKGTRLGTSVDCRVSPGGARSARP
jgi:hypothetical protein